MLGLTEALSLTDGDMLALSDFEGDFDGDTDGDIDALAETLGDTDGEILGETLGDFDGDTDGLTDGLMLALGDTDGDLDGDMLADGDIDGDFEGLEAVSTIAASNAIGFVFVQAVDVQVSAVSVAMRVWTCIVTPAPDERVRKSNSSV